ncbi:hypothetical protein DFQ27_004628 [Actinomortierella ambigua]|uniref:BRCT domain-containing protein n=1 Tax=Actinomortierella ambigua TaxID=1343610 RepID=A0A9P6Q4I2_9FUNG|nr:hypothetical protein DFQ27_004628 [Actinomortierella ambigua]
MREAYEAEANISLSQAPRQSWTKEPQDNLSQLYPYPEKSQSTSREHQPQQQHPSQQLHSTQTLEPGISQAGQIHSLHTPQVSAAQSQLMRVRLTEEYRNVAHPPQDEGYRDDLSCFDMNLDMAPAEEQAWLAEQMIRLVNQLSLGGHILSEDQGDASTQVIENDQQPRQHQTRVPPTPGSSISVNRSSKSIRRSVSIQPEDSDAQGDLLHVKEEASDQPYFALSITSLSPKMKQFVQKVAKMLNTPIIEGYGEGPTHVVTQSRVEASFRAGYWVKEEPHQAADNEFGNNGPKRSRASHARGEPKLLDGHLIQLFGKFSVPSRADLELLIETGGGRVVEDLLADIEDNVLAKIKAEEDSTVTSTSSPAVRQSGKVSTDALPHIKEEPEDEGLGIPPCDLPPTQVIESKPRVRRRVLLFDADKISKRGQDQVLDALRDLRSRAQTLAAGQAQQSNLQYPADSIDLLACSNLLDCIAQYDMAQLTPLSVD